MTGLYAEDVPAEILVSLYRALARLDTAMQKLRQARDYARIESGTGVGTVDREQFLENRQQARVSATAIRADRASLAGFVALATENGVNGAAVIQAIRREIQGDRRANPSGRYYECRRVAREIHATRMALLPPLPKVEFPAREHRYGYDVRYKSHCTTGEIAEPMSMTPETYRRRAARILKMKHAAKVAEWKQKTNLEQMRASLAARGKQTPERVAMAKQIKVARMQASLKHFKLGDTWHYATTPEVRRNYLAAKRRRMASVQKSAERLAVVVGDQLWFAGVQVEDGKIVVLTSDLRAAKAGAGQRESFEGKPLVFRKVKQRRAKYLSDTPLVPE